MSEIRYVIGDATKPEGYVPHGGRCIVHCCNDRGGWGSGFVLALDKLSPEPRRIYRAQSEYNLGDVSYANVGGGLWVANIIGQHGTVASDNPHPVKYDALFTGLTSIVDYVGPAEFSLHMPRMGSGLAGGSWDVIEAIINETCAGVDVMVYDLPERQVP